MFVADPGWGEESGSPRYSLEQTADDDAGQRANMQERLSRLSKQCFYCAQCAHDPKSPGSAESLYPARTPRHTAGSLS